MGERTWWRLGLRVLQGKQVVQAAFYFSDDLKQQLQIQVAFQTACNRKTCCNLPPPPWGRAGERAFSESRQSFPNSLTASIQAFRLVALSLTLSHGREDGAAVVIKGFARKTRKTSCTGCFLFFKRPEINACKSKSLFKLPATAKSAATYPLPRGGGLGRGHFPSCGNLSQIP